MPPMHWHKARRKPRGSTAKFVAGVASIGGFGSANCWSAKFATGSLRGGCHGFSMMSQIVKGGVFCGVARIFKYFQRPWRNSQLGSQVDFSLCAFGLFHAEFGR